MGKRLVKYALLFLGIPLVLALGASVFKGKQSAFISLAVVILAFVPFFMTFERRETNTRRLVVIAVMTALSVAGRFLFAVLPGFKPVTAIVVITAVFFGGEAGFLTGALSALLSNFYFGQGPWTPFQMFAWGMLGLLAGLLARPLKRSRWLLALYGVFAGAAYSLLMDVWSALWYDNTFHWGLYGAAVASSLPFMVEYAVSNVIFLLLLVKPIGEKLERIRVKYGL